MRLSILPVCLSVCHMCAGPLWRPEEDIGSPGTGGTGRQNGTRFSRRMASAFSCWVISLAQWHKLHKSQVIQVSEILSHALPLCLFSSPVPQSAWMIFFLFLQHDVMRHDNEILTCVALCSFVPLFYITEIFGVLSAPGFDLLFLRTLD